MDIRFDGKRALVTGAGKGIGRAIAEALMKGGAETYAISRTQTDLESLEQELPGIHTICMDITNWDQTKISVENIIKDGAIDLLVNNAAITCLEPVGTISEENSKMILETNLLAAINIAQEVSIGMREAGKGGSIVNISSVCGKIAIPNGVSVSSASKGGLDAMTRVMALELGPHKIRVNSINMTTTWTNMLEKALVEDPALVDGTLKNTPLGRIAEVADCVHPTIFLLSDKASMITGVSLPVDGGWTAC